MQTYNIALVMIVKNEARAIKRCLNSVAPYVDSIIVLDTGSTDNTVSLAKESGAQVFHFNWCDDFAAARNAALAYSAADWNLVLDADEWLATGGNIIQSLRQTRPDFVGTLEIVSSFVASDNKHVASNIISRVLPRGVYYRGMIHEQPQHSLPVKALAIKVHHDGYEPEQQHVKGQRNLKLLQKALQVQPYDSYIHYKLAVEYEQAAQLKQALPHYETALANSAANLSWRLDLVIRLLNVYKKTQRFEQGIALAKAEHALRDLSADYYFALGDLYLDLALAKQQQATELILEIEQCWLKCLEIGEVTGVNGAVSGRGSYLAAHNLAVFYQSLGKTSRSKHYFALASQRHF